MDEYKIIDEKTCFGVTDITLTITRNGKDIVLNRVVAIKDITDKDGKIIATEGTLGGYYNYQERRFYPLEGWIGDTAKVYDKAVVNSDAMICGNAELYGEAHACSGSVISGNAEMYGEAYAYSGSVINGDAKVYGKAQIYSGLITDNAKVYGNAKVSGNAYVHGDSEVFGGASVDGSAEVTDNARVYGAAKVGGNVKIYEDAAVCGGEEVFPGGRVILNKGARVSGNAEVFGNARIDGDAEIGGYAKVDFNVGMGQVVEPKQGEPSVIKANRYEKEYQERKAALLNDVQAELIAKLKPQITAKVEKEITAKVKAETTAEVEAKTRAKVEAELREKIEAELREQLEVEFANKQKEAQPDEEVEEEVEEDGEEYEILKTLNGWGVTNITKDFEDANGNTYTLNQIVALKDISLAKSTDVAKKLAKKALNSGMSEIDDEDFKKDMEEFVEDMDKGEFDCEIKEGTLGGFVELNALGDWQDDGESWMDEEACIFGTPNIKSSYLIGQTNISDDTKIEDSLIIVSDIYEKALIKKSFLISSEVYGVANVNSSLIYGGEIYGVASIKNSIVEGDAEVYGAARVEKSLILNDAEIYGAAKVINSVVSDGAEVYGKAELNGCVVYGNAEVYGNAKINKGAEVCGDANVCGQAIVDGKVDTGTVTGYVAKEEEKAEEEKAEEENAEVEAEQPEEEAEEISNEQESVWYKTDRERGLKALESEKTLEDDMQQLGAQDMLTLAGLTMLGTSLLGEDDKVIFEDYMDVIMYRKTFDKASQKLFGRLPEDKRPTVRNMKSYAARVVKLAQDIDKYADGDNVDIESVEELFKTFRLVAKCSSATVKQAITEEMQQKLTDDIPADALGYISSLMNNEEIIDEVDAALENLGK